MRRLNGDQVEWASPEEATEVSIWRSSRLILLCSLRIRSQDLIGLSKVSKWGHGCYTRLVNRNDDRPTWLRIFGGTRGLKSSW